MEGDTVIISATPIPGNERAVSQTIDNLLRQGANVLYDRIAPVHVHGHASQEELKLMLNLTRPKYFVPVHGEFRHLRAHAQLAWEMNVAPDGIFVLEDGDILEIDDYGAHVVDSIPAGPIYLDGPTVMETDTSVLRERRSPGQGRGGRRLRRPDPGGGSRRPRPGGRQRFHGAARPAGHVPRAGRSGGDGSRRHSL